MNRSDEVQPSTFVQVARGSHFRAGTLALADLAPATVCIGPGPDAPVGHLATGAFLDLWYRQPDGPHLAAVPAVLTLMDPDQLAPEAVRVLLSMPRIREAGLEYLVEVVSGQVPSESGACVLLIGPLSAPEPHQPAA